MSLGQSNPSSQLSLAAQMTEPADQPFIDVVRALVKATFLLVNHPERPSQAYDLTLGQTDVLGTLAAAGSRSLTCSEIAERSLITKGGITGLLDRLEARGLVKRIPSRDDRRSVLVRLSAKGVELFRRFYPQAVHYNRSLLERAFEPEQIEELTGLLQRLISSLERDNATR